MSSEKPALKPLEVAMLGFGYSRLVENPVDPRFSYQDFTKAVAESPLCERVINVQQLSRAVRPLRAAGYLAVERSSRTLMHTTEKSKPILYQGVARLILQRHMLLPEALLIPKTIDTLRQDELFFPHFINTIGAQISNSQVLKPEIAVLGYALAAAKDISPWFSPKDIEYALYKHRPNPYEHGRIPSTAETLARNDALQRSWSRMDFFRNPNARYRSSKQTKATLFPMLSNEILKGDCNLTSLLVFPDAVENIQNDQDFANHLLDRISSHTQSALDTQ